MFWKGILTALLLGLQGGLAAQQGTCPACTAAAPVPVVERTLCIIKPDAVKGSHIGAILDQLESARLRVVGAKLVHLTKTQAEKFYAVHKFRPFYPDLVKYMTSGPVMVVALEGEGAVSRYRELMGVTDPKEAKPGTLRARFGLSKSMNAVHGSDSQENARLEVAFFFKEEELTS